MEEITYAPVIIPTLCRYDHFRRCIESLNENHNAENTEVYVSVDFPAKKEHERGHKLICEYLDSTQFCFKKLYVYKQTENLGVGSRPGTSNTRFLRNIVSKKYDRWIFSEDDNEFSPNFLDFIDEALEKFKDDKSVLAIGGYRFFYPLKIADNNFIRQQIDFNAWGYGIWKVRFDELMSKDVSYLKEMVFRPSLMLKVWRKSTLRMGQLIFMSYKNGFKKGDNYYTQYMIRENMFQIMPAVSKVRNLGWDESGLHCNNFDQSVVQSHLTQVIDDADTFSEFKGDGWEYFKENENIIKKEDFLKAQLWKVVIKYFIRILLFWK